MVYVFLCLTGLIESSTYYFLLLDSIVLPTFRRQMNCLLISSSVFLVWWVLHWEFNMPSCLQRFWLNFGVNNSESSGETRHPASHIPGDEIRPHCVFVCILKLHFLKHVFVWSMIPTIFLSCDEISPIKCCNLSHICITLKM